MGIFGGKKKESPTLENVSSIKVSGKSGKEAPEGKNLVSKESARYARAKVKNL